jgi:hypothetical protein
MFQHLFSKVLGWRHEKPTVEPVVLPKIPPPLSEAESYESLGVKSGANRNLIPTWFEKGQHPEVTHMIIRRDQIQQIDFPVYCCAGASIQDELRSIEGENGCDTIAVYNYREALQIQLDRNTRLNP